MSPVTARGYSQENVQAHHREGDPDRARGLSQGTEVLWKRMQLSLRVGGGRGSKGMRDMLVDGPS